MYKYSSNLSPYITDFLDFKESLGFAKCSYSFYLSKIDKLAKEKFSDMVGMSKEFVIAFKVNNIEKMNSNGLRAKLFVIRDFALFLNNIDVKAYVIESKDFPKVTTYIPYLFSKGELKSFFYVVDTIQLKEKHYETILPVLYRMIYCCALRPSEPLHLKREDVDLEQGLIYINNSKRHSERIVMMTSDLWNQCKIFDKNQGTRKWFFSNPSGDAIEQRISYLFFKQCISKANIGDEVFFPRIYDLRHLAATNIIKNWIENRKNIMEMIIFLQAFMGHKEIKDTIYYIHLLPEQMFSNKNVDWNSLDGIYPEV